MYVLRPFAVDDSPDIIDESLQFFKANVFFKSFEVKVRCMCMFSECVLVSVHVCVCVCA